MTEEEELEKLEPKNKIVFDENGMPCIVVPPIVQPTGLPIQAFKIHLVELNPKNFPPKGFMEIQQRKEKNFFDKILKDLEDIFKGWF